MAGSDPRNWMWSEALQMLAQADRLHRQVFRPQVSVRGATWEPPVDMLETETAVLILAALRASMSTRCRRSSRMAPW